jgi:hypothetical protein
LRETDSFGEEEEDNIYLSCAPVNKDGEKDCMVNLASFQNSVKGHDISIKWILDDNFL